jgi:two-component system chemotaxis sensor kinase CheA
VLNQDEINNLIFLPGFSTAEVVSDLSGRGVGMDVVRRNIQDLGGRITLKSEAGRGMSIELALPLTLAVMDGMIVRVAQETYVMPISAIVECIRPASTDIRPLVGTCGALQIRGSIVPLVYLGDLFDVPGFVREPAECTVIVIEGSDRARLGLVVDELCGHQQVVIKSIRTTAAFRESPPPRFSAMGALPSSSISRNCRSCSTAIPNIQPRPRVRGRKRRPSRSGAWKCVRPMSSG